MAGGLPNLPNDAIASSHFSVEIDGVSVAQCQECSGLATENEVITLKENGPDGRMWLRQLIGPEKPATITLKRGLNVSMDVANWRKAVEDGDLAGARKNGSIVFYDFGYNEVARFNFLNGWVSKMTVSAAKAGANEIAVEEFVITTEKLTRDK